MFLSSSRVIAPAPPPQPPSNPSIGLNSIHEIDHELPQYVNFFFQMRDPSLRKDYEAFNDRNQSLPSLLWLNLFLCVATVVMSVIVLSSYASGKLMVGWISLLVVTVLFNAFGIYAHMQLKRNVKQNNFTLSDRSKKYLKWCHIIIFTLVQIVICRRMLNNALSGGCGDYVEREYELIGRCNAQHESASLPSGISTTVMLWPIFHVVCVRGAYICWTLLIWATGVGFMLAAIISCGLTSSTSTMVIYIVTSLIIIAELKRQNYVMYFLDRKLQAMLKDKERQADEESATEMRHMIANVAHDLKTVSHACFFGILSSKFYTPCLLPSRMFVELLARKVFLLFYFTYVTKHVNCLLFFSHCRHS